MVSLDGYLVNGLFFLLYVMSMSFLFCMLLRYDLIISYWQKIQTINV